MAMQTTSDNTQGEPMMDMNVVPLIDVLLVLLIMFIITIPVQSHAVKLDLPVNLPNQQPPPIDPVKNKVVLTQKDLLDRAVKKLEDQIKAVGGVENITEETMPEAHIRGDINTPYRCIGGTVFTMQRAGFARVGFISEPPPGGAVTRL